MRLALESFAVEIAHLVLARLGRFRRARGADRRPHAIDRPAVGKQPLDALHALAGYQSHRNGRAQFTEDFKRKAGIVPYE